jgi:hypothetical protein
MQRPEAMFFMKERFYKADGSVANEALRNAHSNDEAIMIARRVSVDDSLIFC